MTGQALEALRQAEVVVGYTGYFTWIADLFADKICLALPLTQEPGGPGWPSNRCAGAGGVRRFQRRSRGLCHGESGASSAWGMKEARRGCHRPGGVGSNT